MATNRADTLDPALLRPGRLDRKIEFPLPDRRQKRLIFSTITGKMNISEEVDLEDYVARPDKISGADINAICQEVGVFESLSLHVDNLLLHTNRCWSTQSSNSLFAHTYESLLAFPALIFSFCYYTFISPRVSSYHIICHWRSQSHHPLVAITRVLLEFLSLYSLVAITHKSCWEFLVLTSIICFCTHLVAGVLQS